MNERTNEESEKYFALFINLFPKFFRETNYSNFQLNRTVFLIDNRKKTINLEKFYFVQQFIIDSIKPQLSAQILKPTKKN